jgi:hypothetical protein
VGTWTSSDPSIDLSNDPYKYVRNAVLTRIDPSGLFAAIITGDGTFWSNVQMAAGTIQKKSCGKHSVLVGLTLSAPAPCTGHVVAEQTMTYGMGPCTGPKGSCKMPTTNKTVHYFELLNIGGLKDTTMQIRQGATTPKTVPTVVDTQSIGTDYPTNCATFTRVGTYRFYCDTDIMAEVASWTPNQYADKAPTVEKTPTFWTKVGPKEKASYHSIVIWDCCTIPQSTTYGDIIVDLGGPPPGGGLPGGPPAPGAPGGKLGLAQPAMLQLAQQQSA